MSVSFIPTVISALRTHLKSQPRFRLRPKTDDFRKAAVLLPLCHHDGVASVLFTKRPSHLKNHPGQVAFPGGKIDPTDKDETACALRELHEEVGIPPQEVEVIGILPDGIARGTKQTLVTPILGFLKRDLSQLELQHCPNEVESSFTLPIEYLLDPTISDNFKGTPRFLHPFNVELHIWGFSGYVLRQFLDSSRHILTMTLSSSSSSASASSTSSPSTAPPPSEHP